MKRDWLLWPIPFSVCFTFANNAICLLRIAFLRAEVVEPPCERHNLTRLYPNLTRSREFANQSFARKETRLVSANRSYPVVQPIGKSNNVAGINNVAIFYIDFENAAITVEP